MEPSVMLLRTVESLACNQNKQDEWIKIPTWKKDNGGAQPKAALLRGRGYLNAILTERRENARGGLQLFFVRLDGRRAVVGERPWSGLKLPLEGPLKGGVILKAAPEGGRLGGHPLPQQAGGGQ